MHDLSLDKKSYKYEVCNRSDLLIYVSNLSICEIRQGNSTGHRDCMPLMHLTNPYYWIYHSWR